MKVLAFTLLAAAHAFAPRPESRQVSAVNSAASDSAWKAYCGELPKDQLQGFFPHGHEAESWSEYIGVPREKLEVSEAQLRMQAEEMRKHQRSVQQMVNEDVLNNYRPVADSPEWKAYNGRPEPGHKISEYFQPRGKEVSSWDEYVSKSKKWGAKRVRVKAAHHDGPPMTYPSRRRPHFNRELYHMRGIDNISTTACHVSSVILILYHCLPPIRKYLIEMADTTAGTPFLRALGRFLAELSIDTEDPVDPVAFYELLPESIGINANNVGDTVTSFTRIMQAIREGVPEELMKATVDGGRSHSIISEHKIRQDSLILRSKSLGERKLNVPLAIKASGESLQASLEKLIEPQIVDGYTWAGVEEQVLPLTEDAWEQATSRQLHFTSLPNILCIDVERFGYDDGRIRALEQSIDIPLTLDANSLVKADVPRYELVGAILYEDDSEESEEDIMHSFVAFTDDDEWYVIDDDDVNETTTGSILNMLKGEYSQITSREGYVRGVFLVYRNAGMNAIDSVLESCIEDQKNFGTD